MNKYIATMVASLAAFALFVGIVGVAVARPATPGGAPGQAVTTQVGEPDNDWYGRMIDFMDRYRTRDGRFDVNRMMSEVTTGKTTPPCGGPAARRGNADTQRLPETQPQRQLRGYGPMMGGGYGSDYGDRGGYGYGPMMGYEVY